MRWASLSLFPQGAEYKQTMTDEAKDTVEEGRGQNKGSGDLMLQQQGGSRYCGPTVSFGVPSLYGRPPAIGPRE